MMPAVHKYRALMALVIAVTAGVSMGGPSETSRSCPEGDDRVTVPKGIVSFDDGDTINIAWPGKNVEIVRILGIDTPEVLHLDHDLPFAQPFGDVAAGFMRGAIAVADRVELLRSGQKDPFGRTLGYVYLDGKNYSALVLSARLAVESVTRYGDNGMPEQAAACLAAARAAGPVPFEDPHSYRRRMREVAKFMRANGTYPKAKR